MRLSLKHKIIIANLIVFVLTFLVIAIIVIEGLKSSNERMLINDLIHQADVSTISVRQSLLTGEHPTASEKDFLNRGGEFAFTISTQTGIRTLIFSKSQTQVADSENSGAIKENFPELKEVTKGNRTYVIRRNNGSRYLYFAFPVILSGNNVLGEVMFVYPMKSMDNSERNLEILLLISFIIGMLVIVIVSILLSIRIIRPILELKNSAVQISKGSFENKIVINSSDEVGELANAFNTMSRELENRISIINAEKEKQKQFVTNVSHELKTPLTTILGYVDLLSTKGHEKDVLDTSVHYLQSAGERLSVLINDLIDLSSLSRYEFEIKPEITDVTELLRDIIGQMSPKAGKFNIKMHSDLPASLKALIDPTRIKQAVVNILDNSIKYSSGDSINILLYENQDMLYIEIKDNGCGMPEDLLEKIFEPFYRIDKARTRSLGGNGLGLAITREIVEKHNGEVKIESKVGEGTKVVIVLPNP